MCSIRQILRQVQLLKQSVNMAVTHAKNQASKGKTTPIYRMVEVEHLYCTSSADAELFHRF